MDTSKQLHAYEVEYHVLQDEMVDPATPHGDDSERLDRLEKTNTQLKKQNMELLEKLQVGAKYHTRILTKYKHFRNSTFGSLVVGKII